MVFSQKPLPQGYFRSPLDITHYITGIFAEPRPDHLHSGIDFATAYKTGLPLYCIADGYVSRIKVAAGGYGKAIYVTHPNGFVSVYGHLSAYNVVIDDYVKRKQKENESFAIELFPDPRLFPLQKGEVLGYSGNTGNSTGPHLHFEIRSEIPERPINPALFGIYASDAYYPFFKKLMIYPYGNGSTVNAKTNPVIYTFNKRSNTPQIYTLPETVKVQGSCYLSVIARDFVSTTSYDLGIYSLKFMLDSVPVFAYQHDSFAFDETRFANDVIDYKQYKATGDRYLVLKTSPCNRLPIYTAAVNHGIISFERDTSFLAEIIISDVSGKQAVLRFRIEGSPLPPGQTVDVPKYQGRTFYCDRDNELDTGNLHLLVPAGALFDTLNFSYQVERNYYSKFSPAYNLKNADVPLFNPIVVSLRADNVPEALKEKVLMVRQETNKSLTPLEGKMENGRISASSYRFGKFFIAVDTILPDITAYNFVDGRTVTTYKELRVKITDNLSGIDTYRAELNGKWLLMEFDSKINTLIAEVGDDFVKGANQLVIKVKDNCGNERVKSYKLWY